MTSICYSLLHSFAYTHPSERLEMLLTSREMSVGPQGNQVHTVSRVKYRSWLAPCFFFHSTNNKMVENPNMHLLLKLLD